MADHAHDTVEVYRDIAGGWRWRRQAAGNHEVISQGEAYTSKDAATEGAIRANPDVPTVQRASGQ